MLFSELYSAYYNALAHLIEATQKDPLTKQKARDIISENAFRESAFEMSEAVETERWQAIRSDYSTPIKHTPTMPLTTLQKRWLKSVTLDRRFRLFGEWTGARCMTAKQTR